MKRMLQLSILAVAMGLLFGSSKPVEAQRYYLSDNGYSYSDLNRPRYRSNRRKIRRTRHRVKRRKAVRTSRVRRKYKRRYRKPKKRKLASFKKENVTKKKPKFRSSKSLKGPVQIVVSLEKQRVNIYKAGEVIASARVSTGRLGHRTPPGVFSIIQKRKDHYSNLYDSAPMPFMQRITWSGLALHAGNVSRPYQSHGCIRMPYGFAKKLFKSTRMGAHVIVASGSSSLQPITHMSLIQPMPAGSPILRDGVRTAALNRPTDKPARPLIELGGIPGFVKPLVAAKNHLAKKELAYKSAITANLEIKQALELAKLTYFEQKKQFVDARKTARTSVNKLRKPRSALRKVKRRRVPMIRALNKAQIRAKWARDIIEKRRDNPKFEGNWMNMAVARAQSRDIIVERTKEKLDTITEALEATRFELDRLVDAHQKARARVLVKSTDVKDAARTLKKIKSELALNQRLILTEKKNVKVAIARVSKAKSRENLPLRILITPRTGKERIKSAQRLLTEIGYKPGFADGVVGKNTRAAINAFQREITVGETGKVSDLLMEQLYARVGRSLPSSAHMYVRQGFTDLFDVPVDIVNPTKPLGTHVYTAMHFEKGAISTKWTALTIKKATPKYTKKRKGKKLRRQIIQPEMTVNAQEALDRVKLPKAVQRQLSMLLTPGSSMVVSDKGASNETGRGTDFVVLTK